MPIQMVSRDVEEKFSQKIALATSLTGVQLGNGEGHVVLVRTHLHNFFVYVKYVLL